MKTPAAVARREAGRIRDARGRRVTQVDPVACFLLRRHEVIDAGTLRRIVEQKGVRVSGFERAALMFGVVCATLVIGFFTFELITGRIRDAATAKSVGLVYMCIIPWIVWYGIKRRRFGHVAAVMLQHGRCPHCGYDLRMLPVNDADGATVCPECGCAWRLATCLGGGGGTPRERGCEGGMGPD